MKVPQTFQSADYFRYWTVARKLAGLPTSAADWKVCGTFHMRRTPILFLHVLIIATCGLIYELLAGTLASYVLGDSVTQFSLVIGIYLSALGAGAWLSPNSAFHVSSPTFPSTVSFAER